MQMKQIENNCYIQKINLADNQQIDITFQNTLDKELELNKVIQDSLK